MNNPQNCRSAYRNNNNIDNRNNNIGFRVISFAPVLFVVRIDRWEFIERTKRVQTSSCDVTKHPKNKQGRVFL
ncbi:MAG: hypothetical protein ACK6DE_14760 [Pseudanabaena sp.]